MDAKPQRPLRAPRNREDENVPPAPAFGKTIHQRNKSSPALSTLPGAGGTKPTAPRPVLGDVGNTYNGKKSSKDDASISGKPAAQGLGKPSRAVQERKSAAFLRPAQRPLSVSGLKGLLTGVTGAAASEPSSSLSELQTTNQPTNIRKVLTKRNPMIFRDPSGEQPGQTSQEISKPENTASTVPSLPEASKLIPSLHPVIEDARPQGPAKEVHPTSVLIQDAAKKELGQPAQEATPSTSHDALKSDAVYIDEKGNLQVFYEPSAAHAEVEAPFAANESAPAPQLSTKIESLEIVTSTAIQAVQILPPITSHYQPLPLQPESEEYWDDEDEENCDEEGYVTARSYRSKGDTTGGATTILFPHINQKVKREIAAAKKLVEATRTPEEIEDECYDTSMVAEYGEEIFDYMKQLEVKMLPNAHYMDNQHEIQWSMRAVLMDWLVQVHHRFNLLPETLFLCVNYIDRFLSCKVVSLGKLELVGATAIFIAAKYEEINCPSVQEIVYMVDGGYTVEEILKAERFMLTMLQFELGWPGPMSFLRRISKADDYDLETRTLAKYFLEVTIMDERFIGSPPSFVAAGSHCLARMMLRKGLWTPQHIYYSSYTYSQLWPLLTLILECCSDPDKNHSAVFKKYQDKRYKRASAFVETEMQKGFQLPSLSTPREMPPPSMLSFENFSYLGWA